MPGNYKTVTGYARGHKLCIVGSLFLEVDVSQVPQGERGRNTWYPYSENHPLLQKILLPSAVRLMMAMYGLRISASVYICYISVGYFPTALGGKASGVSGSNMLSSNWCGTRRVTSLPQGLITTA